MRSAYAAGLFAALTTLALAGSAAAAPLRTQPGATSITVYEETATTVGTTFALNDARLATRLGSSLGASASDITFFPGEYYDVFFSNAAGVFDADGSYLTIEGVWWPNAVNAVSPFGGMNINEVSLNSGPSQDYADVVTSYVLGSICDTTVGANCGPMSAGLAVDHNLATFPRFGQTNVNNPEEHFRLTLGFTGVSDAAPAAAAAPEPSAWALLIAGFGLAGTALRRRRTAAAA